MYIVIAIIAFGVLITVHELGHFTASKWMNVKVNEFAIGMGPILFKKAEGRDAVCPARAPHRRSLRY